MPRRALKNLNDGVCEVEEEIEPDEELDDHVCCCFLDGGCEEADVEEEDGEFSDEDQGAVGYLRDVCYLCCVSTSCLGICWG